MVVALFNLAKTLIGKFFLLQENGSYLLLEDGFRIVLEGSGVTNMVKGSPVGFTNMTKG